LRWAYEAFGDLREVGDNLGRFAMGNAERAAVTAPFSWPEIKSTSGLKAFSPSSEKP
jgi:hypothetical protein